MCIRDSYCTNPISWRARSLPSRGARVEISARIRKRRRQNVAPLAGSAGRNLHIWRKINALQDVYKRQATSPAARAVTAFFQTWDQPQAASHSALASRWDELMKGVNLLFWYGDAPVSDDPQVRDLWQAHYDQSGAGKRARCLVTGEKSASEEIHPAIKGVQGAQSSGAALVSFNAPAFWSYGHEYAPIGSYAAFAYTTALNHLLADKEHLCRIGDTTVVC